jgi:tRNA nucleotidyltransferase (CCA-adding enzyme)
VVIIWQIPDCVWEVLSTFKKYNYQAYLVGGCVRDLLRGIEAQDWDIATVATPAQVQRIFPQTVATGIRYGTVTVVNRGVNIEVTTFRRDGCYRDQRHPSTVIFAGNIEADLKRRDFTINAMAYNPFTDQLIDPFNGKKDLEQGIIRAVGDPRERFAEDALRMLRAIRFACQMGARIEQQTWEAIMLCKAGLLKIAPERVREELDKILGQKEVLSGLLLFDQSGLLKKVLPSIYTNQAKIPAAVALKICAAVPQKLYLRLTALLLGLTDVTPSLVMLRYPKKIAQQVVQLHHVMALMATGGTAPADIRLYVSQIHTAKLVDVLDIMSLLKAILKVATFPLISKEKIKVLLVKLPQFAAENFPRSPSELAIDGIQLKKNLQLQEGPLVGRILHDLWREVLHNPERNQREHLLERAGRLAKEYQVTSLTATDGKKKDK